MTRKGWSSPHAHAASPDGDWLRLSLPSCRGRIEIAIPHSGVDPVPSLSIQPMEMKPDEPSVAVAASPGSRKGWRIGVGALLVGLVGWLLIVGTKSLFIDNSPSDVFFATICRFDGDFTVYAPGYREARFRSLRLGMTSAEVEATVGPPLTIGQWQVTPSGQPITPGADPLEPMWHYSRAGKLRQGSYWRREVWFRGGVVSQIVDGFHVD